MKRRFWLLAGLFLSVVGCSVQQAPLEISHWRVMPERTGSEKNNPVPYWLTQGTMNVTSPFDTKSLVYRLDEQKYEKDFYQNYVTLPSEMLAAATRQWIHQAGIFQFTVPNANTLMPFYLLQGTVDEMYTDFRPGQRPGVVLTVEYYLTVAQSSKKNNVVFRKKYQIREPIANNSAKLIVQAQQIAFAKLLAQLEEDLHKAAQNFPPL